MGASHCGADGLFERQVRRLAQRAKNAGHARRLLAMAAELDGSSREEAARVGGMDRQMRVGQKNKLTYRCARKARAPAPRRINARSRPICLAPSAPSEAPSETRVSGGRSKASRTASSDSPVGFIITASLDPGLAADCYV